MTAPPLSVKTLRRSPLTKTIAVLAIASLGGCYRTRIEPVAPPPLADSITMALTRGHTITILSPQSDSVVDSLTLTLSHDRTVTLLQPELEGQSAVWGWTRDSSLNPPRTVATSTGVTTLSGADSVRVRVPLVQLHRELDGGKTALSVIGLGVATAFTVFIATFEVFGDGRRISGIRP